MHVLDTCITFLGIFLYPFLRDFLKELQVKVDFHRRVSTFTLTRDFSHIAPILFTHVLTRNFYVYAHVHFTSVNKIEVMHGMSRVKVKGEPPSTFTFARGLSNIASILFTHVKFTCVQVYVRTNY